MSVTWDDTSRADYDKRLAVKGHKQAPEDQGSLFYVPTPTREAKAADVAQLDGQDTLFGEPDER